jgi:hypothetical protein
MSYHRGLEGKPLPSTWFGAEGTPSNITKVHFQKEVFGC